MLQCILIKLKFKTETPQIYSHILFLFLYSPFFPFHFLFSFVLHSISLFLSTYSLFLSLLLSPFIP